MLWGYSVWGSSSQVHAGPRDAAIWPGVDLRNLVVRLQRSVKTATSSSSSARLSGARRCEPSNLGRRPMTQQGRRADQWRVAASFILLSVGELHGTQHDPVPRNHVSFDGGEG